MNREFVGEAIEPSEGAFDAAGAACGGPGIPRKFSWRGRGYEVAAVLDAWKETGACRHGSGERYVRKHWFRIRTTDCTEMEIFFERQARSGREIKKRWWLHTKDDRPRTTDRGREAMT